MPANVYECMVILDPNKVAGDQAGVTRQLHGILEKNSAEVLASRPWADSPKLAYPIKNCKKGLYHLTYFRTEGKNIVSIERDFQLNESILRALILRVDPKMVDAMLDIGRNEHAVALQTVNAPPDDEVSEEGDRGRRGFRRGGGGPPDRGDRGGDRGDRGGDRGGDKEG